MKGAQKGLYIQYIYLIMCVCVSVYIYIYIYRYVCYRYEFCSGLSTVALIALIAVSFKGPMNPNA